MKIACLSDTHGTITIPYPNADVLILAGDVMPNFTWKSKKSDAFHQGIHLEDSLVPALKRLLAKKAYKDIIMIPGNHDRVFQMEEEKCRELIRPIKNLHLLIDEGVAVQGLKFWGSPWSPWFGGEWWAYNLPDHRIDERSAWDEADRIWGMIPEDTEVLITHGPPKYFLDGVNAQNPHVGCPRLNYRIFSKLKKLKLNVFGHIHESYGQMEEQGIKFVNAALMDGGYQPVNPIQVVEI